MRKIKRIIVDQNPYWGFPFNEVLIPELSSAIQVELYNANTVYNPDDCVLMASCFRWTPAVDAWHRAGHKLIVNNLWEPTDAWLTSAPADVDVSRIHVMHNEQWFWYMEASHQIIKWRRGEPQYRPQRRPQRRALLQMSKRKPWRDMLYYQLEHWFADMHSSYLDRQHHCLPGDFSDNIETLRSQPEAQRFVNHEWYDTTYFTIVSESIENGVLNKQPPFDTGFGGNRRLFAGPWPFITEKTYKPIQYQHPFMVWGQKGVLDKLVNLGFISFPNLFDESYDQSDDHYNTRNSKKLAVFLDNIKNFEKKPYDWETQDRINFNYKNYYNIELLQRRVREEMWDPFIKFCYE